MQPLSSFKKKEIKKPLSAFVKEPGYFARVGQQFKQAGEDITAGIRGAAEDMQSQDPLTSAFAQTRAGLRTVGGVSRAAFAPILEAPLVKPAIEKVAEKVTGIPGVEGLILKATEVAKKYPNAAKDIQDIVDIATLGAGGAVEKPLIAEGKAIAKDVARGASLAITPSEQSVKSSIESLFKKSIKPTAKKTTQQGEVYRDDLFKALNTIKRESPKLNILDEAGEIMARTPQSINELAQAVDQTKKIVFDQYDALAKKAGQVGATIDVMPIAQELEKVANNQALKFTNPEVIDYALRMAKDLRATGTFDAETTQAIIKNLNESLAAFYRNPSYDTASKVSVDALVANNMRKALDTAIEGATGQQYQVLKNEYKALKAIENDVVRAAGREARKNVKGLLDYTDIFTSGQMLSGLVSLNPAMFTKGAIERGFKEYLKFLNDPNRAIKTIFKRLDAKSPTSFAPSSAVGKYLKNPKVGMSIEDVTKSNPLLTEARKYKSAEEFINSVSGKKTTQTSPQSRLGQSASVVPQKGFSLDPVYHGNLEKFGDTKNNFELLPSSYLKKPKAVYRGEQAMTGLGTGSGAEGFGLYTTTNKKIAKTYADLSENGVLKEMTLDDIPKNPLYFRGPAEVQSWVQKVAKGLDMRVAEFNEKIGINKIVSDLGHDGVAFDHSSGGGTAFVKFSKKDILNKSQLTDIWKKAHAND